MTAPTLATPSGEDVDASCGASAVLWSVWTRPGQVLRTSTPGPHSALSRPHPHRLCNDDPSQRRRRRPRALLGLLRHPRQFVYETNRRIAVGIPRDIARNNSPSASGIAAQRRIRPSVWMCSRIGVVMALNPLAFDRAAIRPLGHRIEANRSLHGSTRTNRNSNHTGDVSTHGTLSERVGRLMR